MLQDQFLQRLFLILFFGIFYIYTMKTMAEYKSIETEKQRHVVAKIVGALFALSAICSLCIGIYALTQISYPEQTIEFAFSANQIVRPSGTSVIWGYPTLEQNQAIMSITNVFSSIALAAYCFFYKKSDRMWWKKILRFFCGLLMFAFYSSATNFHYFDVPELVAPCLFFLMAGLALKTAKKQNEQKMLLANQQRAAVIPKMMEEKFSTDTIKEEESRFMPQNEDQNKNDANKENEEQSADISACTNILYAVSDTEGKTPDDNMKAIKYCRHCGNKVDYDSSIYCKYCGKKL